MNEFLKEYERFLKNMKEMSHLEWQIDKRLVEAGGLGKTIYYIPARGSCRTNWRLLYELAEGGRDVRVVTNKVYEPKLYPADRKTLEDAVFQLELYSLLNNPYPIHIMKDYGISYFLKDNQDVRQELHTVNPYTDLASHWIYKIFEEE